MAAKEQYNSNESDDSTDSESDDSSSSKKKKVGRLGSMVVDSPKTEQKPSAEKKSANWQRILGEKPDKAEAQGTGRQSRLPAPEFASVKSELSETQAETGELADDEATPIIQATARGRHQEVAKEKAAATSQGELRELAVAEAFLEHAETTGDLEQAIAATQAEFNLTDTELADVEQADAEFDESVIDISDPHEGELPLRPAAAETDDTDDEDDTITATAATSGTTGTGGGSGSGTPSASGGSAGGGTPPPTGPTFTPGGAPFGGGPVPPTPNLFPSPVTNPNTSSANRLIDAEDARYYERRALQRGLVTGLIVGFLYGRRRGRIKAEKRFAPVQKKLEKQVTGLQSQVYETELKLRKQAAAQVRKQPSVSQAEQQPVAAFERADQRSTVIPIAEQRRPQTERQINTIERTPRPAPERIGQVLVRNEAIDRLARPEQAPAAAKTEKLNPEKQVQLMNRHELLELSEKIAVDGANLRQIYETHLVGEQGLRRIVVEHLRGGDIHKVLRRELVEREIDFERDPILRDKARASLSAGGGSQALNNLLSEAGVNNPGGEDSQLSEVTDKKVAASQKRAAARNRRLVDGALGGTIAVLISVILFILLHR